MSAQLIGIGIGIGIEDEYSLLTDPANHPLYFTEQLKHKINHIADVMLDVTKGGPKVRLLA